MNQTLQILSSASIGTIVGALVTFWGNRWLAGVNHRRATNQFLIEKRIAAYNEVEKIITALDEKIIVQNAQDGKITFHGYRLLTTKPPEIAHCSTVLGYFAKYSYLKLWLSPEIDECLKDVFNLVYKIDIELSTMSATSGTHCILNNEEQERELNSLVKQALELFYRDCVNLKDLKRFIKSKRV